MTTVRRTQSSLSHTSSEVSDKVSPLGCNASRRFLERDVAAQDAIAQEAKATQVGKARPLSESGQHWQVKRRAHPKDRQVDLDATLELVSCEGALDSAACLASEQRLERVSVEADRDDHQVVGDALALVAVLDRHDDLPFSGVDLNRPSGKGAKSARLVEGRLRL